MFKEVSIQEDADNDHLNDGSNQMDIIIQHTKKTVTTKTHGLFKHTKHWYKK